MTRTSSDWTGSAVVQADADVVRRVLAGDVHAFGEVVARYQGILHRYAVAMVLDHDEAHCLRFDGLRASLTKFEQGHGATTSSKLQANARAAAHSRFERGFRAVG